MNSSSELLNALKPVAAALTRIGANFFKTAKELGVTDLLDRLLESLEDNT